MEKLSTALRTAARERIPAAEVCGFLVSRCGPDALERLNTGPARRYVSSDIAQELSFVNNDAQWDRWALGEAADVLERLGQ